MTLPEPSRAGSGALRRFHGPPDSPSIIDFEAGMKPLHTRRASADPDRHKIITPCG